MRVKRFGLVLASAGLIFGLTGLMSGLAVSSAGAAPGPAIKLSGGKKPCSVKKDNVTNNCSVKVTGSHWIAADGAVGITECSAGALTGDPNACDDNTAVIVNPAKSGKWTIKDYKVIWGTIGNGTCGAGITCYIGGGDVASQGANEQAMVPFTEGAGG